MNTITSKSPQIQKIDSAFGGDGAILASLSRLYEALKEKGKNPEKIRGMETSPNNLKLAYEVVKEDPKAAKIINDIWSGKNYTIGMIDEITEAVKNVKKRAPSVATLRTLEGAEKGNIIINNDVTAIDIKVLNQAYLDAVGVKGIASSSFNHKNIENIFGYLVSFQRTQYLNILHYIYQGRAPLTKAIIYGVIGQLKNTNSFEQANSGKAFMQGYDPGTTGNTQAANRIENIQPNQAVQAPIVQNVQATNRMSSQVARPSVRMTPTMGQKSRLAADIISTAPIMALQSALARALPESKLTVDGKLGSATLDAMTTFLSSFSEMAPEIKALPLEIKEGKKLLDGQTINYWVELLKKRAESLSAAVKSVPLADITQAIDNTNTWKPTYKPSAGAPIPMAPKAPYVGGQRGTFNGMTGSRP